jgi:hypothetical protein
MWWGSSDGSSEHTGLLVFILNVAKSAPLPLFDTLVRRSARCGKSFMGSYNVTLITFMMSLYVITSWPGLSKHATGSGGIVKQLKHGDQVPFHTGRAIFRVE